jgi:hypothetical protein
MVVTLALVTVVAASSITLRDQSRLIGQRLVESAQQIRTSFPIVERLMPAGGEAGGDGSGAYAVGFARSAATAVGMIVLALALTVYLLIDWLRERLSADTVEIHEGLSA